MALPWTAWWRDGLAWLVIATLLAAFGLFIYEITAPDGAPITPVAARVAGFSVKANSSKRMVSGDPALTVDFQLADGERVARSIGADEASRCRVGQVVQIGLVTTHGGTRRAVVPSDPCGH